MSSNGPRRDQHADDSRRAILAAARHAFARDGYARTSLDEIVAPARLTKGALYHHFKNKAALLEAVYVEMEEELATSVKAAVMACAGSAWDRMVAAVDAFFTASAEPAYVRIVLCDAPQVLGTRHGREIDQAIGLGLVVELLSALQRDGAMRPVPVLATARILLAAASEVAMAMAHADDPAIARRDGSAAFFALLDGLRAPVIEPVMLARASEPRRRR
jgi:AcrR family transcriptional regulator